MTRHSPNKPGGLYDPQYEHDACGVAFVADPAGRRDHEIVAKALIAHDPFGIRFVFRPESDNAAILDFRDVDVHGVTTPRDRGRLLEVREPHQSRTMHCRHEALYSPLKRPSSLDIGSQQAHYGLDRNASSKRPGLQCQFVDRKASGTPAFSFSSRSASGVFGSGIFVCCASEAQHQSRRFGVVRGQAATKRRFPLILIKPSHYDDDE